MIEWSTESIDMIVLPVVNSDMTVQDHSSEPDESYSRLRRGWSNGTRGLRAHVRFDLGYQATNGHKSLRLGA